MDLLLQIWAGGSYLLNKALFAFSERKAPEQKRTLKIIGWSLYILGVPAWVVLLVGKQNWIAAAIELGGLPAMLFGLYNVLYDQVEPRRQLAFLVSLLTYSCIVFGVSYSVIEFAGIHTLSQCLELLVMVGFLLGGNLLARGQSKGWLFFMLMNLSMAMLMYLQGRYLLAVQQMASLGFVIFGFYSALQNKPLVTDLSAA